jgi:hypothetical protein
MGEEEKPPSPYCVIEASANIRGEIMRKRMRIKIPRQLGVRLILL